MSAPILGLNEYKAWLKENKTNSLAWPFNLWLSHMKACENTRLFNAVPDLLKALITLRNDCYNKEGEIVEPSGLVLDMADKLIKKLTSGNP